MNKNIINSLHRRYGKEIKIYPPIIRTCKEVYIIDTKTEKIVVMTDRKLTPAYQYRFLRSNHLQRFLYQQGLPVAKVCDIFYLGKPRIAAEHSYINGKDIENIDAKTAYKLGEIVAKFHLCPTKNFHPVYPLKYKFFDIINKIKNFFRITKLIINNKNIIKLPFGICHYDLNLTNFMQTEDKIFLIDFDRWRYWPFACELVRFIQNNPHKQAIINGYQSVRMLTTSEKEYLLKNLPELKL
jgi:hypothetical protein